MGVGAGCVEVHRWSLVVLTAAAATSTPARAQDDFPIIGTYTENTACVGADASVLRVKITARDIDSPILGLCSILGKKRDGHKIPSMSNARAPAAPPMLGDVTFTIKDDNTLDFADQDNTYKAVLHKCAD